MLRLRPPTQRRHAVAAALLLMSTWLIGMAPQVDANKVAQVKSAFVVNFVRYTRWPDSAFGDDAAPITVAVVGHDPMGRALDDAATGKKVAGRQIAIRRVAIPTGDPESSARDVDLTALTDTLADVQVVFVSEQERRIIPDLLTALRTRPVLVVSDAPNFCRQGGMLGFVLRDNRLAFEANPDRIDAAHLKVSSKLLKLATIVKEGDG